MRALAREMSRISLGPSQAFAKTAKARQLLKTYSRISVIDGGVNYNSKTFPYLVAQQQLYIGKV
jgi:hypothetical protein